MNLPTVTVILLLTYACHCSVPDSNTRYQNSLSALISPTLCQLKLICAISQSEDYQIKNSNFMRGISVLSSYRGNLTVSSMVGKAIRTGETGLSCSSVAPDCDHTDRELLLALQDLGLGDTDRQSRVRRQTYTRGDQYSPHSPYRRRQPWTVWSRPQASYSPFRRQGLVLPSLSNMMSNMPPIFRPDFAGRRAVCRSCDQRSTVCTVYSVGTYAGCTGVWLVAGVPGQLACNVATAPGSIGCGMNTLHCYMSGCGLINLPRLP